VFDYFDPAVKSVQSPFLQDNYIMNAPLFLFLLNITKRLGIKNTNALLLHHKNIPWKKW
jgi:hypothetical protein